MVLFWHKHNLAQTPSHAKGFKLLGSARDLCEVVVLWERTSPEEAENAVSDPVLHPEPEVLEAGDPAEDDAYPWKYRAVEIRAYTLHIRITKLWPFVHVRILFISPKGFWYFSEEKSKF